MIYTINGLMRLKKTELVQLFENERQRADEQYDRAEILKEDLDNMETYEEESIQLDEVKDLVCQLKTARVRYFLGIDSERETMENLLEKLMEIE
jgi:beta-phosphoglucomutase-like phosphatase (HAD superfamily)